MGNKESLSHLTLSSQLANIHPLLRQSKVVSTNYGPMLEYPLSSQSTITPTLRQYLRKQRFISDQWLSRYLLLPQKVQFQSKSCGQSQVIMFYYEFFPFRLDTEIEVRRSTRRVFREEEIWYILYSGVSAIAEFERKGESLGKITSQNILLNPRGHIRYINKYSWPGADITKQIYYAAPEEFEDRRITEQKSSIFNLGLVLVECLTLCNMKQLYQNNFNLQKFYDIVQELNTNHNYSQYLKGVVRRMIEPTIESRATGKQLFEELKTHQYSILYFHKFT